MTNSRSNERLSVNPRSLLRVLAFTIAALAPTVTFATAHAERVLVLRPLGEDSEARRAIVEQAMRAALDSLAYEVVLESETTTPEERVAPESANDYRALGELARCEYVLGSTVRFVDGGYRLHLEVAFTPRTRMEPLVVEVRAVREQERLVELFRAVLRPDGIGDAATRFATPDAAAAALESERAAELAAEAERRRQEEEARLAQEAAAAEEAARLAEEARQREALAAREDGRLGDEERAAWENRERYGRPQRRMVSGGFGFGGILNPPANARGGAIAELEGRFGYSFPDVPGLEARAGIDVVFGSTVGLGLTGGAVYLASPWQDAPVHVGGGLELGYYQAFTGNRVAQLLVRAEGIVSWHATDALWLEAAVPMITVLSANGGVMTAGFSLRAGTRF